MRSVLRIAYHLSLTMLLFTGYHSTAIAVETAKPEQQIVMGDAALIIPEALLPQVEGDALQGSVSAARRLADFYGTIKRDPTEGRYWAQILAENGNGVEQYNYGTSLQASSDLKDQARSVYWLNLAKKDGVSKETETASKLLKELGDQHKTEVPNK